MKDGNAPDWIRTTAPDWIRTTAPDWIRTTAPGWIRTTAPDWIRTTAPEWIRTTAPDWIRTTAPDWIRTTAPDWIRTTAPDWIRTTAPDWFRIIDPIFSSRMPYLPANIPLESSLLTLPSGPHSHVLMVFACGISFLECRCSVHIFSNIFLLRKNYSWSVLPNSQKHAE